jgi:hypothetical protein
VTDERLVAALRADTVDLAVLEGGARGGAVAAPAHLEPAVALEGRARLRQVIDDLAVLPESQRHALVRRELDGITHAQLARELGMSEPATRSLVHRARGTLAKLEGGRRATCEDVRDDLLAAHDERRRPQARTLRHLAGCAACRDFRTALRAGGARCGCSRRCRCWRRCSAAPAAGSGSSSAVWARRRVAR